MRIIVHFGMPKTGSTSIQKTLHKNRLNLTNICYPDFGMNTPNHNTFLCSTFRENSVLLEKYKEAQLIKLKEELELNLSKNCDVLLSAELLAITFNFNELQALHSVLTSYTKEVVAVGYIRSPKAYMESVFQEALKAGKIDSLNLEPHFPYYQTFFEKFDQIFGRENVHFWKFSSSLFPDNCVVSDFCQRLNIKIPVDSIVRVNESLSLNAIALLYTYSKYKQAFESESPVKMKSYFTIKLPSKKWQKKKLRFASTLVRPIVTKNRKHIKWMEARMGESLAEDLLKDNPTAVYKEDKLFRVASQSTKWLARKLGADYSSRWHPQMSEQEIAEWMHVLRLKKMKLKENPIT